MGHSLGFTVYKVRFIKKNRGHPLEVEAREKHLTYEKNPSFFAWLLIAPQHGIVFEPASHLLLHSYQKKMHIS